MHLKTHFKFQFKSSRISTTSVHVIFFLNTKLHHDANKIVSTQFGSTNLEIYILQNSIKNWINELAFEYTVTVSWVHLSAGPHVSDKKNRGRAGSTELAGGDLSDDGTGVTSFVTTLRTYRAT